MSKFMGRFGFGKDRISAGLPKELTDGYPWHQLTVNDIGVLRKADYMSVSFNSFTGYSGIGLSGGVPNHTIPAPSRLKRPRQAIQHDLPYVGSAFISLFPGIVTEEGTVVKSLRPKDRVRLLWWEDGHTNDALEKAGLHADFLRLEVARGDDVLAFDLCQRIVWDCSSRLIRPFDPAEETNLALSKEDRESTSEEIDA